ncbi:MAG: glycoside hydrolase family 20 zincin-like fold domain-containing protein, partial [Phenylobacterium sp.]
MIRSLLLATAAAAMLATGASAAAPIIPAPVSDTPREGAFQLDARTVINAPANDAQALASARYLADLLERSRGLKLAIRAPKPGERAIVLSRQGPAGEAYKLDVEGQRVSIASAGDAG